MNGLVPVRVRDCACPDTPHEEEGDIVYLVPKVSLALGVACTAALSSAAGDKDRVTAAWLVLFVQHGAVAANFIDPFDVGVLLADYELSHPVAEAANDLYAETILRPLGLTRRPTPGSPRGQTGTSTSPTRRRRKAA